MRSAVISRVTKETEIRIEFTIDGTGKTDINTGIAFFDHILNSFAKHGVFDLTVSATGDLKVDDHHLIEDIGIVLGSALQSALKDKKGINRFGHAIIPMDESLAIVALDISGRSYLVFDANFKNYKVGDFTTDMIQHFFESFVNNAGINANMQVKGINDHHKIEALFKAFGIALRHATMLSGRKEIPSTKGVL